MDSIQQQLAKLIGSPPRSIRTERALAFAMKHPDCVLGVHYTTDKYWGSRPIRKESLIIDHEIIGAAGGWGSGHRAKYLIIYARFSPPCHTERKTYDTLNKFKATTMSAKDQAQLLMALTLSGVEIPYRYLMILEPEITPRHWFSARTPILSELNTQRAVYMSNEWPRIGVNKAPHGITYSYENRKTHRRLITKSAYTMIDIATMPLPKKLKTNQVLDINKTINQNKKKQ